MSYKFKRHFKPRNTNRINEQIIADKVYLVEEDSTKIVTFQEALSLAKSRNLDLVEITQKDVPIVKILDYGKFRFNKLKKEKENKKKQKSFVMKEIKMGPKIDIGDYERKREMAKKFLEHGDSVKVTMRFKGREMAHTDLGAIKMKEFAASLDEYAILEKRPTLEGRQMTMVLRPKKK